jgi:hypothetical protein
VPYDEPAKADEVEEDLQRLIDAFPGHDFHGFISGAGENNEDMFRLYVYEGRVVKHSPEIVWPSAPRGSR